jgi:hypothetical protein
MEGRIFPILRSLTGAYGVPKYKIGLGRGRMEGGRYTGGRLG